MAAGSHSESLSGAVRKQTEDEHNRKEQAGTDQTFESKHSDILLAGGNFQSQISISAQNNELASARV